MASVNKVILVGRLTRDPEMRYTATGAGWCKFGLATDRFSGKGEDGEAKRTADFHNIVAWDNQYRKLAELCAEYLHKGSLVYLEGRLQTRSWDAEDGTKRSSTEVVINEMQFMEPRGARAGEPDEPRRAPAAAPVPAGVGAAPHSDDGEIDPDDIPFLAMEVNTLPVWARHRMVRP